MKNTLQRTKQNKNRGSYPLKNVLVRIYFRQLRFPPVKSLLIESILSVTKETDCGVADNKRL